MVVGGSQVVTSIRSSVAKGPTRVRHSKAVPRPACCAEVNVIDSASVIQRTWVEMSSIAAQRCSGEAFMRLDTRMRAIDKP